MMNNTLVEPLTQSKKRWVKWTNHGKQVRESFSPSRSPFVFSLFHECVAQQEEEGEELFSHNYFVRECRAI